ncbi:MAG: membrane dipeptidase [Myxococcota bacterium]
MPNAVRGFADLHAHLVAHRGMGGKAIAGEAWNEKGYREALANCQQSGKPHNVWNHPLLASFLRGVLEQHGPCGYPTFADWPTHRTVFHQQMYIDWVKRAYTHGLRLMCMLVVNNELMARQFGAQRYSDPNMLDSQLNALGELVTYVNKTCDDAGVPRWLGVAKTPAEARTLINNGQLALVVGVEMDTLESLARRTNNDEPTHLSEGPSLPTRDLNTTPLTSPEVDVVLNQLVARGVSMVTPVHLADNSFGGSALYDANFDLLNRWLRGKYFDAKPDGSVAFQLKDSLSLQFARGVLGLEAPKYGGISWVLGHVNQRGLTPLGQQFLTGAMKRGLLIDVDHMSTATTDAAIALAKQHQYPVLSSHSAFRDLGFFRDEVTDPYAWAHEGMKTKQQVDDILSLGGLVAPITNQHRCKQHGNQVANSQHGTSRTWAQAFLYAISRVQATGKGGVALGTDFNGFAQQPGPRFSRPSTDATSVRYGDPNHPAFFTQQPLSRMQLPLRANPFDYNYDGLAHYGLLPDFIEDLRNVGVPDAAVDELFNSAERFIQCWETCLARAPSIP